MSEREALARVIYEAEEAARAKEDQEPGVWVPWEAQTSRREQRIYLAVADAVLAHLHPDTAGSRAELADEDDDAPRAVRCRVTFLGVRPPVLSERRELHVTVPHLSRAEEVARKQGDLWEEHWHVYSVVEEA